MTREQRQQQIKQMFPDEVLDIQKPDILRGKASPQPEGKPTNYAGYAVAILSIFVLLAFAHYMGWIETAKYGV